MSSVKTPMLLAAGTACVIAIAVFCVLHLQKEKQSPPESKKKEKKKRPTTTPAEAEFNCNSSIAATAAASTTTTPPPTASKPLNGSVCSPTTEMTGDEIRLDSGIGSPKGTPSIENRSTSEQTVEQASDLIEESFSAVCYSKANGIDSSSLFVETSAISAVDESNSSSSSSNILGDQVDAQKSLLAELNDSAAATVNNNCPKEASNDVSMTENQATEMISVKSKKGTPVPEPEEVPSSPKDSTKASRRKSASARKEVAQAIASSSSSADAEPEIGVPTRNKLPPADDRNNNNTRRQSTGSDVVTGSEGSADSKTDSGCHSVNASIFSFKFEFELPSDLCGRLIGRQGSTVKDIRDKTGATVTVRPHINPNVKRVFVISKQEESLRLALAEIRKKFPLKQFPHVTMNPIDRPPSTGLPTTSFSFLYLPEDSDSPVQVTDIEGANHMYVQMLAQHTFVHFVEHEKRMVQAFSQAGQEPPTLPADLVQPNAVCVLEDSGMWFRAVVVGVNEEEVEVKFVDYGGYDTVHITRLKQIRSDFLLLPFQALEVKMATIEPIDPSGQWTVESIEFVQEILGAEQNQVLARVLEYVDDVPSVDLLLMGASHSGLTLAELLVNAGHARWVRPVKKAVAPPPPVEVVEDTSGPRFSPADFPSLGTTTQQSC